MIHSRRRALARITLAIGALAATPAFPQFQAWGFGDDGVTPYVQSPMDVVERMLRLAEPKKGEFLIDLGSGDGRIVIEAARRYGTRGLGVDLDEKLVRIATENARRAGVAELASFRVADLYEADFSQAEIISAYLLPEVNLKIRDKLLRLRPGTRIVTHDYHFGDWPHDEMVELPVAEKLVGPLGRSKAFLFIVPANARGTWTSSLPGHGGPWRFRIGQKYQVLEVEANAAGREQQVRGMRLRGEEIRLIVTGLVGSRPWNHAFRGQVKGDRIEGEVQISNGEEARTLPWTAIRTP